MLAPLALFLIAVQDASPPGSAAAPAQEPEAAPARIEGSIEPSRLLLPPTAVPGASFGHAVLWFDDDGDGEPDLAVSAPGENAVYVFRGPDLTESRRIAPRNAEAEDEFGFSLAAAPLDGRPGDELWIGAPGRKVAEDAAAGRVYVASRNWPAPISLFPASAPRGRLGHSVAILRDGKGRARSLVAGAPKAEIEGEPSGAVAIFDIASRRSFTRFNPSGPKRHGNHGHQLAAADVDGDGVEDLVVSALGNDAVDGTKRAGQVLVYFDLLGEHEHLAVVEDPTRDPKDPGRFGMYLDAGDVDGDGKAEVLVGAPRRDGGGVKDAGIGWLFRGSKLRADEARAFVRPDPRVNDILGFRARLIDVIGGPRRDVLLLSLSEKRPRALVVWDGEKLDEPPREFGFPAGSNHHFGQGIDGSPPDAEGNVRMAFGDLHATVKGQPGAGRVVISVLER